MMSEPPRIIGFLPIAAENGAFPPNGSEFREPDFQ